MNSVDIQQLKSHPLNEAIYRTSQPDEFLLESIRANGLLEPVVLDNHYTIISGHRRVEALKLLGVREVSARFVEENDPHRLEEMLIEHNRYRVKVPSELLREIKHLKTLWEVGQGSRTDLTSVKFDGGKREDTRSKIAKKTGVSAGNISKLLFIEERMPHLVRDLDDGIVSTHQAFLHARKVERQRQYSKLKKIKDENRVPDGVAWRVITGDARTTQLEPESVQTIICSPPYWGLRDYKHKQAIGIERSEEEFLENLFSVFDSLKPTLKKDGCLFVEIGDAATGNTYSGILERFVLGMISRGWMLRERLIVSREQSASNRTKTWSPAYSMMYFFTKSKDYKFDRDSIRRPYEGERLPRAAIYTKRTDMVGSPTFPNENGKIANNIIKTKSEKWISKLTQRTGLNISHPAPFSRDVVVEPILATTEVGDVVLDCFSGSGTTGVVCIQTDRRYIGLELNPVYAEMSRVRLNAAEEDHEQQKNNSTETDLLETTDLGTLHHDTTPSQIPQTGLEGG